MHYAQGGRAAIMRLMGQLPVTRLIDDPVLARFRAALDAIYGDRLERVTLFGSRARGDAHTDSDYDIAIFLNGFIDRWRELDLIVPLVTDIVEETGAVIHPLPFRAGAWRDRTPLMHELRLEAVDL
jgi:predicted nucleotidyltransferase